MFGPEVLEDEAQAGELADGEVTKPALYAVLGQPHDVIEYDDQSAAWIYLRITSRDHPLNWAPLTGQVLGLLPPFGGLLALPILTYRLDETVARFCFDRAGDYSGWHATNERRYIYAWAELFRESRAKRNLDTSHILAAMNAAALEYDEELAKQRTLNLMTLGVARREREDFSCMTLTPE